jgi:chromosome segregation protein
VLLEDWLCHVYIAESSPLNLREQLPPGAILVNRQGHVFTRHSVSFHAADSETHGVLARGREIEQLISDISRYRLALEQGKAVLDAAQQKLQALQAEASLLRSETEAIQAEHHRIQIETLRLTQSAEQFRHRAEQITQELAEIREQQQNEAQHQRNAESNLAQYHGQTAQLEESVLDADRQRLDAETRLNSQRAKLIQAQQVVHEAQFIEKSNTNVISGIDNSIKVLDEQISTLQQNLQSIHSELSSFGETPYQEQLQQALQVKQVKEQALTTARNASEEAARSLQQTEEERLAAEGRLEPLRSRINDLRLKEQEARLNEEQYREQLHSAAANEEELGALLQKGTKTVVLQAEIARLNQEITAMGAVNLAALEELQSASERKSYLDSQAKDLEEAVETMENAIRRIDRETRARLMETFDAVNRHLDEMFPMLFGGGQARLVLSGEEILDSGVQVIAQPPGKKNTTIHLLSGGEKALAALALIFSLFQLNPAPFCMLDEVDAPLDDTNTERFCELLRKMSEQTQFIFISHNKITMEIAHQLIGITMQELGVSRVVSVDIEEAMKLREEAVA